MTIQNNFFPKKYDLIIVNQPTPHKLCRICDSDGDLSKPWYVEYYAWDQTNEKLKRKRLVLNQETAKERYSAGKIHSKKIDALLKEGSIVVNALPKKAEEIKVVTNKSKIKDACVYFIEFNNLFSSTNNLLLLTSLYLSLRSCALLF